MLLLSVSAATSLAEERARGSLDILLSTPLSTFSILVGKWWGAFRLAPHVIFWPALLAGILVWDGGSWFGYVLLLALVLAYSVAIASLGLALATWVSRLGRAVAICVSIVVGFSVGWMFLIMSLFRPDYLGIPLIMGSPLYGTAAATSWSPRGRTMSVGRDARSVTAGALLWILIHSGAGVDSLCRHAGDLQPLLGTHVANVRGPLVLEPERNLTRGRKSELDDWPDDELDRSGRTTEILIASAARSPCSLTNVRFSEKIDRSARSDRAECRFLARET